MNTAYLSLGQIWGIEFELLKTALETLEANYPIEVVNVSSIYETDPVGYEDQDLFLNMVAQIHTELSPIELLDACSETETELR